MNQLSKFQSQDFDRFVNDIDRYTIGMESLLNSMFTNTQSDLNYPHYNTIDEGDGKFLLELALAGFDQKEISVYTEENKLFVCGTKTPNTNRYLHKGIANRSFKRFWVIPDGIEVKTVSFDNGILSVNLEKVVQENQKKKVWFGTN